MNPQTFIAGFVAGALLIIVAWALSHWLTQESMVAAAKRKERIKLKDGTVVHLVACERYSELLMHEKSTKVGGARANYMRYIETENERLKRLVAVHEGIQVARIRVRS